MLSLPCRECGAPPGIPCVGNRREFHDSRYAPVVREYYSESERRLWEASMDRILAIACPECEVNSGEPCVKMEGGEVLPGEVLPYGRYHAQRFPEWIEWKQEVLALRCSDCGAESGEPCRVDARVHGARIALSVACSECEAGPGEQCVERQKEEEVLLGSYHQSRTDFPEGWNEEVVSYSVTCSFCGAEPGELCDVLALGEFHYDRVRKQIELLYRQQWEAMAPNTLLYRLCMTCGGAYRQMEPGQLDCEYCLYSGIAGQTIDHELLKGLIGLRVQ